MIPQYIILNLLYIRQHIWKIITCIASLLLDCEWCWLSDHTISNCKIHSIIMFHKNTFRCVNLMEFKFSFAKYYHVPTSISCSVYLLGTKNALILDLILQLYYHFLWVNPLPQSVKANTISWVCRGLRYR